jgi:FtsP/CotA-like multicopper oxidase with cupredoxin domain
VRQRVRLLLSALAALALVVPLAVLWQHSRLPATYSVADMGYPDYGGGPQGMEMAGHAAGSAVGHGQVSVADLVTDRHRPADVTVDLVARKQTLPLAGGATTAGYTVNGTSPGPLVEVTEGDLLEVHLHNQDVPDGITLHWHGVDLPNGEDGVAGVTQDAVAPGEDFTYRFVADHAGTYWYHSHQVSHQQVVRGLLGPLVVHPRAPAPTADSADVVALAHSYAGTPTLNGRTGDVRVPAGPGQPVRVRVVNTDNGPLRVWAGAPFRLLATDGREVHDPGTVDGRAVTVTAGGRYDLGLVVPRDGAAVRVQVGAATALVVGPPGADAPPAAEPEQDLDLLHYGTPAPLGFDPGRPDRSFDFSIGRRPGFVLGRPGVWWSINGHLFPNVPMFMVREGDVVVVRFDNHSGDVHPMHLHGHHAVVLSRDGHPATGAPWWFDSLNVKDGETFEVAFVADNPGVWMDHCHNLNHAAQGLVTHLMYEGVTEPFRVGGPPGNEPE